MIDGNLTEKPNILCIDVRFKYQNKRADLNGAKYKHLRFDEVYIHFNFQCIFSFNLKTYPIFV